GDFELGSEGHEMRRIRNLRLVVGHRTQALPHLWIENDERSPGLQSVRRRGETYCLLQDRPLLGRNFAARVKFLGCVSPMQLLQQLLTSTALVYDCGIMRHSYALPMLLRLAVRLNEMCKSKRMMRFFR